MAAGCISAEFIPLFSPASVLLGRCAAGPLLPAGTAGAAEREQERSRRRRPRGYTFSTFPTRPEVRTTRMHRHVQSSQPPPWTPIVPIHKRESSPWRGPALVSRTGGTARDHGPPVPLPKGRPEALPCHLGGKVVPLPSWL